VTPGSSDFSAVGTNTFVVPAFNTLTVEIWGGGGSGAAASLNVSGATAGSVGGTSWFGNVYASGGQGGGLAAFYSGGAGGAGGTAAGGLVNSSGGAGEAGVAYGYGGAGGASPNGGAGGGRVPWGYSPSGLSGGFPGGGGSGNILAFGDYGGGGGGGGGAYSKMVYSKGALAVGSTIQIVVGAGAVNSSPLGGGAGANGRIVISWN
jgi:hypothetical protein